MLASWPASQPVIPLTNYSTSKLATQPTGQTARESAIYLASQPYK